MCDKLYIEHNNETSGGAGNTPEVVKLEKAALQNKYNIIRAAFITGGLLFVGGKNERQ